MSTPATPLEPTTDARTTDFTATDAPADRWRAADGPAPADPEAPLTFDARCRRRLPNGMDAANQYDGRRA